MHVAVRVAKYKCPHEPSTVQLWELATGNEIARVKGVECWWERSELLFGPRGKLLIGHCQSDKVTIWRVSSDLKEIATNLHSPRISPDERWLLAQSEKWEPELYDTAALQK